MVSEKRKALQKSVSTDEDLGFTNKADPESTNGKGDSKESMSRTLIVRECWQEPGRG